jgi:hypothetical protein
MSRVILNNGRRACARRELPYLKVIENNPVLHVSPFAAVQDHEPQKSRVKEIASLHGRYLTKEESPIQENKLPNRFSVNPLLSLGVKESHHYCIPYIPRYLMLS